MLHRLGKRAFPTLSAEEREHVVVQRYCRGLNDEGLRQALTKHYQKGDFENGNMYSLTKRFERVTLSSQAGVHSAQLNVNCPCSNARTKLKDSRITVRCDVCDPPKSLPTKRETQSVVSEALNLADQRSCYNCGLPGHLRYQCPMGKRQSNTMSASVIKHHAASQLASDPITGLRELRGACKINGLYCDFLTDTGAERTIVHKNLIPENMWNTIIPTFLTMVVASGVETPLVGELDCNIELGGTLTRCRALVTDKLNATCLLGMDVLTRCPLTKEPIRQLYEAVLSGIRSEVDSNVVPELRNGLDQVQCFRAQVLTPEQSRMLRLDDTQRVLVAKSKPYNYRDENRTTDSIHDDYDIRSDELPKQAFHDVFQVVGAPIAPEPLLEH